MRTASPAVSHSTVLFLAAVPADRLATMAALAPEMGTGDGGQRFAFGLELLVDGLAALAVGPPVRSPRGAGP
ncbi:MAG TPA: TetR/AcrR family transcriptional regulator C-terminal domain-containing protein [Pseudonocardia sp.]|nr:TetR/AcrR family transcriptional regulator C-terminal domain-containing protein [Pseudonocardia sp.]